MRAMADANPAMRGILSNPEALRQMLDPATLRAAMQMQQAVGGMGGMPGAPRALKHPSSYFFVAERRARAGE